MDAPHLVALATALIACLTDLRNRRIPNVLTFGSALAAVAYHALTGGWHGALVALGGWGVGLLMFLLPFALGGMGGGDVKLVAAAGAWLGPADAVWLALYTGVAGGVMAIIVALAHGYLRTALSNVSLLLTHWRVTGIRPLTEITLEKSKAPKLAYAIPIFVGTVATTWLR